MSFYWIRLISDQRGDASVSRRAVACRAAWRKSKGAARSVQRRGGEGRETVTARSPANVFPVLEAETGNSQKSKNRLNVERRFSEVPPRWLFGTSLADLGSDTPTPISGGPPRASRLRITRTARQSAPLLLLLFVFNSCGVAAARPGNRRRCCCSRLRRSLSCEHRHFPHKALFVVCSCPPQAAFNQNVGESSFQEKKKRVSVFSQSLAHQKFSP